MVVEVVNPRVSICEATMALAAIKPALSTPVVILVALSEPICASVMVARAIFAASTDRAAILPLSTARFAMRAFVTARFAMAAVPMTAAPKYAGFVIVPVTFVPPKSTDPLASFVASTMSGPRSVLPISNSPPSVPPTALNGPATAVVLTARTQ